MLVHVSTIRCMTKAIVTKTGNSYALRVPKSYIDNNDLKLGDRVDIPDPLTQQRQALDALLEHTKGRGSITGIKDPVAWQRKQRSEWDERLKKQI